MRGSQAGSIKEARKRLHTVVTELAPRLLSAVAAAANFERRQVGNLQVKFLIILRFE